MVVPAALAAFSQVAFSGVTRATATLDALKTTAKERTVTLHTVIVLNAILDLGILLAVAAVMFFPQTLDRGKHEAKLFAFAAPLSEDLAA